jgi:hypothetical protein
MDRRKRNAEIYATVLLALATIASAWSAYQATRWSGEQATAFSEASANRTESTRASTTGGQVATIDVTLFAEWAAARAADRDDLADFWEERFRTEFKPAFEAWLASDPLNNPDAPATPFQAEQYTLADIEESERLLAVAEERAADARTANQRGDNYILTTVLFAIVLFFAGTASKFEGNRPRVLGMSLATFVFVGGVVLLVLQPVNIGF